mmetsp:Transcript_7759/g.16966  ORF Transcript_7759/g.16966 Transcript_7759/m.16966 type:complete len:230 (-) Transcript_7759:816-1505(-)
MRAFASLRRDISCAMDLWARSQAAARQARLSAITACCAARNSSARPCPCPCHCPCPCPCSCPLASAMPPPLSLIPLPLPLLPLPLLGCASACASASASPCACLSASTSVCVSASVCVFVCLSASVSALGRVHSSSTSLEHRWLSMNSWNSLAFAADTSRCSKHIIRQDRKLSPLISLTRCEKGVSPPSSPMGSSAGSNACRYSVTQVRTMSFKASSSLPRYIESAACVR